MPEEEELIYKIENLKKVFTLGSGDKVEVLKGVNLTIKRGEFLVIFGPSGCGKSTLLHTLIGLEPPTSGSLKFLGKDLYSLNEDQRADLREKTIGMLYQQPTWITSLKVIENVAFPLMLQGMERERAMPLALSYLAQSRMEKWKDHFPQEMSGGQQQRVGLARAVVANPPVLITDEPTGNLDQKASVELMDLLMRQNQSFQRTMIMVTHDLSFLDYANRIIKIVDGMVTNEYSTTEEKEALFKELIKNQRKAKLPTLESLN